ncbi:MAG: glycosyltransferase family 39 protein [Pyrinomonadaceae bacterium]
MRKKKVQSPEFRVQSPKPEVQSSEFQDAEFQTQSGKQQNPDSGLWTLDWRWLAACLTIIAVAVIFRFWNLTLNPLHHDEGVNGYFLRTLFLDGVYKYDPTNYHGPTLYYIALAFTKIFGLETFAIRASVGVFGVLIVVLTFFLRKYLGAIGSLFAALLLALSPGMVYISRYFIHEIFFVFCSFGIVLGVLFFIEGRAAGIFASAWMTLLLLVCFLPSALNLASAVGGDNPTIVWIFRVGFFAVEAVLVFFVMRLLLNWNDGRPIYLLLASASTALLFATKETAFVTIGTFLLACFSVWLWHKIQSGIFGDSRESWREHAAFNWKTFREKLGGRNDLIILIAAVAVVFAYVFCLFFSSFFTYPEGIGKAFEAYSFWTKTGKGEHTQNGTWAYAKWLFKIESPILFLSAIGTLIALFKAKHRLAMFAGFWAFGLFAAYTIIPYKTPWLALSFILPMCLVAGYGINELFNSKDIVQKILAVVLAIFAVGVLGYQSYDLNFVRYDDDKMPYVYAHTQRGFLDLIKQIEHYADKSGKGKDVTIEVVSPDYWSMPWYTKDYPHVNYPGQIVPANTAEMIVAKKDEQDAQILSEYAAHYKYVGTYPLRPGVELYLLVRRDLADKDAKEIYQIEGIKPVIIDSDNSIEDEQKTKSP